MNEEHKDSEYADKIHDILSKAKPRLLDKWLYPSSDD